MKILERIVDGLIRQVVSIDDSAQLCPRKRQYGCNLCGPAVACEIPSIKQQLYMAFVNLNKEDLT